MRKLTQDEAAKKSTVIAGDLKSATVVHTVKPNKESPVRYEMTVEFDLSGLDAKALTEYAVASIVIDMQRDWRAASPKEQLDTARWERVIDVAGEMYARTRAARGPADPVATSKKMAAKMTEAQIAEHIKLLQSLLKK